jgi:hypothetical protein
MKKSHYEYVAIQMALRHPDALKYTKEYIEIGFMKEINEEINNYLYKNFGLDFSYINLVDRGGELFEVIEYSMENCTICNIPSYTQFMGNDIESIPNTNDEILQLPKALKASSDTNELRISTIDEELFKLYDAEYNIIDVSKYSIKGNRNDNTRTNNKLQKLHNIIQEKLWTKLL